jgi:hypothetical protein
MRNKIYKSYDTRAGHYLLVYKKYNTQLAYFKYIRKHVHKRRKKKMLFHFKKKNYTNLLVSYINFNTLIRYFNYFFKFYFFKFIKLPNKYVFSSFSFVNLQIVYFNLLNKNNNLVKTVCDKFFILLNFLNIRIFYLINIVTFFYFFYLNNFFSLTSFFSSQKQLILKIKKKLTYTKPKVGVNFYFNYFRLTKNF